MREKIKQISALGWIGIVLVSISLAFLIPTTLSWLFNAYSLDPWQNAKAVAVTLAINIFSDGVPGHTIYTQKLLSALTGIALFFIIGPGLFILFGIGTKDRSEENQKFSAPFWGFVAGLIITIAGLISMGMQLTVNTISREHSKISASRSAKTDEIRQNLVRLATESFEYLVLPEKQGGGNGSFEGLTIRELPSYGELDPDGYRFGESQSDTLLRIIGSEQPDYTDDDKNSEKVTLIVNVTPSDMIQWENRR